MTSKVSEEPLETLYLRIEYGDTPEAVLGVSSTATEAELRDAYRSFALKIHPDKAPDDSVRELHTLLFQKVQSSYDALLNDRLADPSATSPPPQQLPETLAALHARNVAFKEALQKERTRATDAKHANAEKEAKLKAKNKRLARVRKARERADEAKVQKREEKVEKEAMTKVKTRPGPGRRDRGVYSSEEEDWEQEEDRLANEERLATAKAKVAVRTKKKFELPPQDQPTARTRTEIVEPSLDTPIASAAEIEGRWNQSLLKGGTSGSVSLAEKAQKDNNAAATSHKTLLALTKEADALYRCPTDRHLQQDAVDAAFVQAEEQVDAMVEEGMRTIDLDVREQHLLDQGEGELRARIGELRITWK